MSYIRCTSNPESLYVVGTGDLHTFNWTDYHGEIQFMNIPSGDFCRFFEKFREWEECNELWDEVFEYKGITLRTVRNEFLPMKKIRKSRIA